MQACNIGHCIRSDELCCIRDVALITLHREITLNEIKCLGLYAPFNSFGHIGTGVSWDNEAKYF